LITDKNCLDEDHARILAAETLLGLESLHNKNIIFRDLKPDNIVIDSDGHAMVTDFGLAKFGLTYKNATQSFCGSIAYLAPEMLNREGHNLSIDWYLFGVLIYEMIAGIPPFYNGNYSKEELFEKI